MDIPALIELGYELAKDFTESAQTTVLHYPWIRAGSTYSEPVYDVPVAYQALVDETLKERRNAQGGVTMQRASIGFLEPVAPNAAPKRVNPIDPRDKFVLANGYTGPILWINEGMLNPNTNAPYAADVILG